MTAKTERADAIRWIQAQMDDYGLTLEGVIVLSVQFLVVCAGTGLSIKRLGIT